MVESNDDSRGDIVSRPDLALDEYQETLAYLRHCDQLGWTILGISITTALGLWAYTFKDLGSGLQQR